MCSGIGSLLEGNRKTAYKSRITIFNYTLYLWKGRGCHIAEQDALTVQFCDRSEVVAPSWRCVQLVDKSLKSAG